MLPEWSDSSQGPAGQAVTILVGGTEIIIGPLCYRVRPSGMAVEDGIERLSKHTKGVEALEHARSMHSAQDNMCFGCHTLVKAPMITQPTPSHSR